MSNDLVSIIMFSYNDGNLVEESVKSVLSQTYQNWELLFFDDASSDDTVSKMMEFMKNDHRIKVTKSIERMGSTVSVNSMLKIAKGRWIAFIGADTIWEPDKLERQLVFMEKHNSVYSYTKYRVGRNDSYLVGGPNRIPHKKMMKCCWPAYFTVLYDAMKIDRVMVRNLNENNNYALLLTISKKAECILFPEVLSTNLRMKRLYGLLPLRGKFRRRYEVYRIVENMNQWKALFTTYRNFVYTIIKQLKYVE